MTTKAPASLGNAYIQAIMAILNAPFRPQLQPLDNDPDFIAYSILFHWGSGAPDFYPRLSQFCSVDSQVAQAQVQSLIDRIQGKAKPHVPSVAETMTRAFINLYQRVIQAYQNQMNTVPPPSQSQIAAIQASIAALRAEIKTLTTFLKTLQKQNGG